jgi:hypothetical protein
MKEFNRRSLKIVSSDLNPLQMGAVARLLRSEVCWESRILYSITFDFSFEYWIWPCILVCQLRRLGSPSIAAIIADEEIRQTIDNEQAIDHSKDVFALNHATPAGPVMSMLA